MVGHFFDQTSLLLRMFIATIRPVEGTLTPAPGVRPSICEKSPSACSFWSSAGTALQAASVSFEQMYMKPVSGLYADGGQFAPPSAPGAKATKPLSSYGS